MADTGTTLASFQAQDADSRAKISADTASAAVVAINASAPATSVSSTPSDPRSQLTGYTIVSFIKRRRVHNDPEYTYVAKVRTEQGSIVTHLYRKSELPNRAETVSIFEAYDAYCNTSPPPLPTTYSAWPKSQPQRRLTASASPTKQCLPEAMRIAALKLAASLNLSEGDFVDFKKSHSIEGTWGVPLKAIRPFLFHLAGFGLKFDLAALKINHIGNASGTVQDNLRRVLPSLSTHALVILADETLSHAMNAFPSANGPTLTDASGIDFIDETTGFNQVIYILSLATTKPENGNLNVMEAAPMEPNGMAYPGATMERTKVSAKGKAKKKSTTTASTKGKAKLKAPLRITATVQQLPNTAADGEQSPPDAGSEALRELLQRTKLAYPSDSDDETKDDLDVANQLFQT
ncbi:hypothetical protein DYB28_001154 [Aphanomyces astaci]|uniref:Uncharacterized protein n=1 Tax=Aphanomyces astaci TaxID=112090 RepID=A0A397E5I4_APHAT|nr:hypothetical protein DYB30_012352 [Aphanomyces astaci]RHZ14710.1 hypothetical protein DYB26_003553 [Aphanomyces astaci]RHZ15692.1 hypothetical protein DYB31_005590 [Aphanomyces astaci]RLN77967.1 hypothetical protein DYB28_001154 [Aphanomyces astaci]